MSHAGQNEARGLLLLRWMVGGLWIVAGCWKVQHVPDVRLFFATLRGVPRGWIDALTYVASAVEIGLGSTLAVGWKRERFALISLVLVGIMTVIKALWPRRGGDPVRICSCYPVLPGWKHWPLSWQRAWEYAGNVALLCGSTLLWRLALNRQAK